MMPKTLKELNWFNFPDGFKEQSDFTIWQAIAYILKMDSKNKDVLSHYTETFGKLENEMAFDLLEYYEEFNKPLMVSSGTDCIPISYDDFVNSEYELESIALSEGNIEEDLSLLNQNRFTFIESMVLPDILCNLLLSDVDLHGELTHLSMYLHRITDPSTLLQRLSFSGKK